MMKTCSTCKTDKTLDAFQKDRSRKDGLQAQCKECRREYHEENREKIREYHRKYYQANREEKLKYHRKWCEANREKISKQNAARRAAMSDAERVASASLDLATHRSSLDPFTLRGGATYTEAVAFTVPFAEERLRLEAETDIPHHIDHIKPICEGGLHVPENLQVLSGADNLSKGPVWFEEDLTDEEIERLEQEILEFAP